MLRRYVGLLIALLLFVVVHEGLHALVASAFDELKTLHIRPFGMEVVFRTPVEDRAGPGWAYISGLSNAATLAIGYCFFAARKRLSACANHPIRGTAYWVTVLFLLADAFNLSLGPFIYGGDINGIAAGLGVSRYLLQSLFFAVLMVNRELVVHSVLPTYGVRTGHPLFRPLLRKLPGS